MLTYSGEVAKKVVIAYTDGDGVSKTLFVLAYADGQVTEDCARLY